MTSGQQRALRELESMHLADPEGFEVESPSIVNSRLEVTISLRLGPMEKKEGGLDLREREDFVLIVPPDFPFDYPALKVGHKRFAGFPHVVWAKTICLYQSKVEWNPADGLYGYFDRLAMWLGRAAINDMDPVEGPLEPPHHIIDYSQKPFVIRSNAPVEPGKLWFGLAEVEKYPNRIELVGWNDLKGNWPKGRSPALALILPKPLPMEFPEKGKDFFNELLDQGLDRHEILRNLALASFFSSAGDPIYLVLGLPMRRAVDGSPKLHVAVWATDPELSNTLRNILPEETDTEAIRSLRQEIEDLLYSHFENTAIKWCKVLEDRSEIVQRRDASSPMAWFAQKKVLILGCGALGSWAAEMVSRSNPKQVDLVDNSIVKPGLLVRQNYRHDDIGENKAAALKGRLKGIIPADSIQHFNREAHKFITEDLERFRGYDVVLDCTASGIFHMKLERDWVTLENRTPTIISIIIDSKARRCLGICVDANSKGGVWDAYMQLKYRLCLDNRNLDITNAFYSKRALETLFQPEPGCSDPTFTGSAADVLCLVSTAINIGVNHVATKKSSIGFAFLNHDELGHTGTCDVIALPSTTAIAIGEYKIRISENVYRQARAWVRQNNRFRSPKHETGGMLWGLWDDAVGVIWIFDASGPPPDSVHDPEHFICGAVGAIEEHERRFKFSHGVNGFIGFWHTHPEMASLQSLTDIGGMAMLVSRVGQNRRKAIMLIFGRTGALPTAGIHIYESRSLSQTNDLVSVGMGQIMLASVVV